MSSCIRFRKGDWQNRPVDASAAASCACPPSGTLVAPGPPCPALPCAHHSHTHTSHTNTHTRRYAGVEAWRLGGGPASCPPPLLLSRTSGVPPTPATKTGLSGGRCCSAACIRPGRSEGASPVPSPTRAYPVCVFTCVCGGAGKGLYTSCVVMRVCPGGGRGAGAWVSEWVRGAGDGVYRKRSGKGGTERPCGAG